MEHLLLKSIPVWLGGAPWVHHGAKTCFGLTPQVQYPQTHVSRRSAADASPSVHTARALHRKTWWC